MALAANRKTLEKLARSSNQRTALSAQAALKALDSVAASKKQPRKKKKYTSKVPILIKQLELCGVPAPRWANHPDKEYKFHERRKWALDVFFPEYMVAVEVEGGTGIHMKAKAVSMAGNEYTVKSRHLTQGGFEEDSVKYFEAAKKGISVIRVTSTMVKDGRAASMALQMLMARGWGPPANNEYFENYRSIVAN